MSEIATLVIAVLAFFGGGFGGFYLAMFSFRNLLDAKTQRIYDTISDLGKNVNAMKEECARRGAYCPALKND
jgi:hypothetical protein